MEDPIVHLKKKVENSPNNLFFRYSLAQAQFGLEKYQEAIEHLNVCIAGKSDWMMAYFLLAQSEIKLGRIESAKVSLSETMRLAEEQGHDDPLVEASDLLSTLESP